MLHSLFGDIRNEPLPPVVERATILGYGGLMPFALLMFVLWFSPAMMAPALTGRLLNWGMIYSAVILSFMGGIHWGIAVLLDRMGDEENPVMERLTGAVIPALIAWIAVIPDNLLPTGSIAPVLRFVLMLFAFLYLLVADRESVRLGLLPEWYGRLREKITFFLTMIMMLIIVRLFQLYGI